MAKSAKGNKRERKIGCYMNIQTKFGISDEVHLIELGKRGRIIGIYVGDQGLQYHVRWLWHGDLKTGYWFPDELIEVPKEKPTTEVHICSCDL